MIRCMHVCFIYPNWYWRRCDVCGGVIEAFDYFLHGVYDPEKGNMYRAVHLRCFTEKEYPDTPEEVYDALVAIRKECNRRHGFTSDENNRAKWAGEAAELKRKRERGEIPF